MASLAGWADELRAMAAIGLLYAHDGYDRNRYARIQRIAAEMLGLLTEREPTVIERQLAADIGYVTVKVGVAAAIFDARDRLLLVRRRDNALWAMPGGWADVGDSPAEMTAREVREETGLLVSSRRLIGLYDSRRRGFRHVHQIYHLVFDCVVLGGKAVVTDETLAVDWFTAEALPSLSPGHLDPIRDAFHARAEPEVATVFD